MAVKLFVIGGFLGAGKTSAIVRLGKRLIEEGNRVGIVTNDQGSDLVDTNFLQSEGMAVFEVTKGCFCCNFDEFTAKLNSLSKELLPDVILAEPVGSCTDLIATIFKPIYQHYDKNFSLAPLSVVVDPRRALKFISAQQTSVPINEINYLFDKQLSEADIILLNKCDLLTANEISTVSSFFKVRYPGAVILPASTLTGEGMAQWLEIILSSVASDKESLEIDYTIYANAEAALGWLNLSATVEAASKADCNGFLEQVIESIQKACIAGSIEIAHLKMYAVSGVDFAKAGIVLTNDTLSFNKRMQFPTNQFNIILNARIQTTPEKLKEMVFESLNNALKNFGGSLTNVTSDCFSPSYPKPVWRMG